MHKLQKEQIRSWKKHSNGGQDQFFPSVVFSDCPHCTAIDTFSFSHWKAASHGIIAGKTSCSHCSKTVRFILLDYDPTTQSFDDDASLWICPLQESGPNQAGVETEKTSEIKSKLTSSYLTSLSRSNDSSENRHLSESQRLKDRSVWLKCFSIWEER